MIPKTSTSKPRSSTSKPKTSTSRHKTSISHPSSSVRELWHSPLGSQKSEPLAHHSDSSLTLVTFRKIADLRSPDSLLLRRLLLGPYERLSQATPRPLNPFPSPPQSTAALPLKEMQYLETLERPLLLPTLVAQLSHNRTMLHHFRRNDRDAQNPKTPDL